ncbi:MAG: ARMT1-like domain-containing protein [Deltaproteobacteria bacterium]
MRIEPECIPCVTNMAVSALRHLGVPHEERREIFSEVLQLPVFRGRDWDQTSPEVIEKIWETIRSRTHQTDPFLEAKRLQNERVLDAAPVLRRQIQAADDPLKTAVHMAIIGNSIDLMIDNHAEGIEAAVKEGLGRHLPKAPYALFSNTLKSARRIVYLSDNAGEIVFDKLLLEFMRDMMNPEVYFVVRSVPTMNDVTLKEARDVGISDVATVIENGISGPVPGTCLARCSQKLRQQMECADLIISKGGGNFDVLEEDLWQLNTDTTFLLLCKCHPYERYFRRDRYDPIIWNRFLDGPDPLTSSERKADPCI